MPPPAATTSVSNKGWMRSRALHRQELEQLATDAETFATALALDLLDAEDFVR